MKSEGVRVIVRFRPPWRRDGELPSEMSVSTTDDRTAVLRCVHAHHTHTHLSEPTFNTQDNPRTKSTTFAPDHCSLPSPPLFGCRNPKHPDQLTSYQVDRVFGPTAQQAESSTLRYVCCSSPWMSVCPRRHSTPKFDKAL